METWKVLLLAIIAVFLTGFFIKLWIHKKDFDAAMLGLITLPVIIVLIIVVNPDSIKIGDVELNKLKKEAREATEEAKAANQLALQTIAEAQKTVKLAVETSAMVTWNSPTNGQAKEVNEQQADTMLKRIYGDEAVRFRKYLQKEGVFDATPSEKAELKSAVKPSGIDSPLLETIDNARGAEPAMKK